MAQIWVLRLQMKQVEPQVGRQMVHENIGRAKELDPLNPLILALYSVVLRSTGQFQKTLKYAERGLAINPKLGFSISSKKESLLATGEYDKAFEYRKIVLTRFFSKELIRSFDQIHKEQGYVAAEKEIVHQFELLAQEKYVSPWVLAARHYSNKEYSKDLYDSARFIAVVDSMNLPPPKK